MTFSPDPHQHEAGCDFRNDPQFDCSCSVGFTRTVWPPKISDHVGSRHHIDEEIGMGAHYSEDHHMTLRPLLSASVLPTDSKARKEYPMYTGLLKYFPRALAAVAQVSYKGNQKHNPGEPLHWSRDKSNDHHECIARHLLEAGGIDETNGVRHSAQLAWRALAALEIEIEKDEK